MICALNVKSTFGRITTKNNSTEQLVYGGKSFNHHTEEGGHFLHTLRSIEPEFSCLSKLKMDLILIDFSYLTVS